MSAKTAECFVTNMAISNVNSQQNVEQHVIDDIQVIECLFHAVQSSIHEILFNDTRYHVIAAVRKMN